MRPLTREARLGAALAPFAAVGPGSQTLTRAAHHKVVDVESRGFLLAGAVAMSLGVGVVAVRNAAGPLPGPKITMVVTIPASTSGHKLAAGRGMLVP